MDQRAKMRQGKSGKAKRGKRNPQRPDSHVFAGGRISKRAGKRGSRK